MQDQGLVKMYKRKPTANRTFGRWENDPLTDLKLKKGTNAWR